MKKSRLHLLPLFIAAVAAVASLCAANPDDAGRRKADYIFLEAAYAADDGRYDDYYYLLRRAAALAPEDTFIAAKIAEVQLQMPLDSVTAENAYKALKTRFYADPTNDAYAGAFGMLASNMNRIDDIIEMWQTLDSLQPKRTDPAYNLATALFTKYRMTNDSSCYDRGMKILDRLEKVMGTNLQLAYQKISALLLRNDTAAIVSELEKLRRGAPADVSAQLLMGNVFEHLDMPDSALTSYNRAAELDPEDGNVYLARAEFFRNRGDSVAYDREVFNALESSELEFDQKFNLLTGYVSKLYTDTLQWPRIGQMFAVLQQLNPGEARLHDYYSAYKSAIGQKEEAAEQLSYSLDLDPSSPDRWRDLTILYFQLNDTARAESTARQALKMYPESGSFQYLLANALMLQNRPEDALKALEGIDTLRINNKNLESSLYASRGDVYSRLNRNDEAQMEYKKAVDLNPDNYMAMNNWAYFNAVKGIDLDAAELYASIASAAEPWSATFLDTYAWVLFKKKNYEKALEVIEKALAVYGIAPEGKTPQEINPAVNPEGQEDSEPSAEVFDHAGDIYYWNHLPQKAVDFWKRALKLDSDNELIRKKVRNRAYYAE